MVKAYSRRRELQADKLASQLINKESMIYALNCLKEDTPTISKNQKAYAAFKINSPKRVLDIFSTHPSIDKRIAALNKLP